MTLKDALIAQFDREVAISKRVLANVPEGKFDWKPHPKSMQFGYLAQLVAMMPVWMSMVCDQPDLDLAAGNLKQEPWKTADDAAEGARRVCGQGPRLTRRRQRGHDLQHQLAAEDEGPGGGRQSPLSGNPGHAHPSRPSSRPVDGLPAADGRQGRLDLRAVGRRQPWARPRPPAPEAGTLPAPPPGDSRPRPNRPVTAL